MHDGGKRATQGAMELSQEALALHRSAIVVDLHADTAKLMVHGYDWGRRHQVGWLLSSWGGHLDLPRMRQGGLTAQCFGLWTHPWLTRSCAAAVERQLDALDQAAARRSGEFRLVENAADIRAGKAAGLSLGLRAIEGAHALEGKIENLERFVARGVRLLGLLHLSASELGYPSLRTFASRRVRGGLQPFGCEVVDACARLGVVVDLAHIERRGFFEAIARRPGPVVVSHTGLSAIRPSWRNIDDEQVRAVAGTGGVVGIIFARRFIGRDLEAVVEHVLRVVRLVGDEFVGLGSDWDGLVRPVFGLESPLGLPHLTQALLRRGLAPESVLRILGGNVLRLLERV